MYKIIINGGNAMNEKNQITGMKASIMLLAISLPYFFSQIHRYAFGVIGTVIAEDYGLTTAQLGILGSALLYTYAAMQIPTGFLADKVSPKKLLVLSCILAAISSTMFAMSSNFTNLVIARALTGVATALVYVPAMAIIRNQFGDAAYGSMVGFIVAMGKAGNVAATSPLKLLNDWIGWKAAFLFIGAVTLVVGVLAWFLIYEEKPDKDALKLKREMEKQNGGDSVRKADMKSLFSFGSISIMIWFFFIAGSRLSFQSLWASKFFQDALGSSASMSGIYLTMMSIGGVFGGIVFGRLADKIGALRALIVATVIFCGCWGAFAAMPVSTMYLIVAVLSLVLGAVGAGLFTVCFTCVKSFVSAKSTGIATGFNNFFSFFGSAIFTQFTGNILGLSSGTMKQQFNVLFVVFFVMGIGSLLVVIIANRKKIAAEKNA